MFKVNPNLLVPVLCVVAIILMIVGLFCGNLVISVIAIGIALLNMMIALGVAWFYP